MDRSCVTQHSAKLVPGENDFFFEFFFQTITIYMKKSWDIQYLTGRVLLADIRSVQLY